MATLKTDGEAMREFEAEAVTELWGTPVPEGEWVGPGAKDEFRDGKGDGDDGKQAR